MFIISLTDTVVGQKEAWKCADFLSFPMISNVSNMNNLQCAACIISFVGNYLGYTDLLLFFAETVVSICFNWNLIIYLIGTGLG